MFPHLTRGMDNSQVGTQGIAPVIIILSLHLDACISSSCQGAVSLYSKAKISDVITARQDS